jgi:uncharacterized damage-inducible protein DinB
MKMTDLFAAQIEREALLNRRALERVPEGRPNWRPHDKSMPLGYLATLVATMPAWIAMAIEKGELDIAPVSGPKPTPPPTGTTAQLLNALDDSVGQARSALRATSDDFLMTPWRLLAGGRLAFESPRHVVIEDTLTHMAHHRGQLTVYLRLNGAAVPSIYGPSADEKIF